MPIIEIIGLLAAFCTTAAFVPQVYKVYKNKSTTDISLTMYVVFLLGTMLWLAYGIHYNSLAIILANAVTGLLALTILIFKIGYK